MLSQRVELHLARGMNLFRIRMIGKRDLINFETMRRGTRSFNAKEAPSILRASKGKLGSLNGKWASISNIWKLALKI